MFFHPDDHGGISQQRAIQFFTRQTTENKFTITIKKSMEFYQSWHSVGPEPIPEPDRADKVHVSVGSVLPFLDSRSVRYFYSVST